ncbi:MAG TPA: hypothetical protein VFB32_17300 [Rudaea sp.]|nr:hypothetical protein [Rudaea sp.]
MCTLRLSHVVCAGLALVVAATAVAAPDYAKRAQKLDPSLKSKLLGKWTNPIDKVVIELVSLDLESGLLKGKEWPTTGQAANDEHELIGWVSAAPPRENFDNVIPVSFSTTLYEYGTLPVWAGYVKDDQIVTMHYLIWPNRAYPWDHVSTLQETWSRLPAGAERSQ